MEDDDEKVKDAVHDSHGRDNMDHYLLALRDADSQKEDGDACFEESCGRDVGKFAPPPPLDFVRG